LLTGRNFGHKTQKWLHKNISGRKICSRIFCSFVKKWPNCFEVCYSHENLDYRQK
jgi:hypothetical protein